MREVGDAPISVEERIPGGKLSMSRCADYKLAGLFA